MVGWNSVFWYCVVVCGFVFVIFVVVGVFDDLFVIGVFEVGVDELWVYVFCVFLFYLFVKNNFNVNSKFFVVDQGFDVKYYKGFILMGDRKCVLKVYVVYYGFWSLMQKVIVYFFLNFFSILKFVMWFFIVKGWWVIIKGFRNIKRLLVVLNVVFGS